MLKRFSVVAILLLFLVPQLGHADGTWFHKRFGEYTPLPQLIQQQKMSMKDFLDIVTEAALGLGAEAHELEPEVREFEKVHDAAERLAHVIQTGNGTLPGAPANMKMNLMFLAGEIAKYQQRLKEFEEGMGSGHPGQGHGLRRRIAMMQRAFGQLWKSRDLGVRRAYRHLMLSFRIATEGAIGTPEGEWAGPWAGENKRKLRKRVRRLGYFTGVMQIAFDEINEAVRDFGPWGPGGGGAGGNGPLLISGYFGVSGNMTVDFTIRTSTQEIRDPSRFVQKCIQMLRTSQSRLGRDSYDMYEVTAINQRKLNPKTIHEYTGGWWYFDQKSMGGVCTRMYDQLRRHVLKPH
jgi:hypothetical protein